MALSQITFYGDESGSHGSGEYVISGYLGPDTVWEKFDAEWHQALQAPPSIEFFHMRECFKQEGQFRGFTQHQANKKLYSLADVLIPFVRKGQLVEFTSTFDWEIYKQCVSGIAKRVYDSPYLLNLWAITWQSVEYYMQSGIDLGPICYVLDEQTAKTEHSAARDFYVIKKLLESGRGSHMDSIQFRDDRFCYALQAADLIAWQRHHKQVMQNRQPRPEWTRLNTAAAKNRTSKMMIHRKDGIREFVAKLEAKFKEMGEPESLL